MYGASAVHGIVNVLTPRVADLADYSAGLEGGSDSFVRLRLGFAQELDGWGIGAYGVGTSAPGWRDSSGVDEAKLNLLADGEVGGGTLRLRAAGTVLNQETAGFIQGYNSYRDEDIAKSNPNPEAFRDASSARVSAHYQRDNCFSRDCRFELAGIYRRSRMDFIQHFLIGKPFEHNAQTSYMVSSTLGDEISSRTCSTRVSRWTPRPRTRNSRNISPDRRPMAHPPANAIRPAGLHYDYVVDSNTIGSTLAFDWRFASQLVAGRGAARRSHGIRLRQPHDRWQHRPQTARPARCPAAACIRGPPIASTPSTTWRHASRCPGNPETARCCT